MNHSDLPQPLSGNVMPRCGGIASMMRLPVYESAAGLDACFVGVPFDLGTSNRTGTRFGPRQIRAESVLLRPYNVATRKGPFEHLRVADIGDVAVNPYNLHDSIARIEAKYDELLTHGAKPITLGGDHTIALPILRSLARKYGKVGLVHVDAHADINDTMFGEKIAHGTPFRRAVEEGLIEPARTVQIGLRGTGYAADEFDWGRAQGFTVVEAQECWNKSMAPLMREIKTKLGAGPVYVSFDIDSLDPAYAPGTGTPEIGGLTVPQALEIIRGLDGLEIIGGDVVEVSPPYDPQGTTALVAANIAFEILCILPGIG
ncbi:agmatinase [Acidocella sp. KAb 2-4]|uniref:agmatinase n=1 Tax=Acidocella sp. KAb 2-4 TaxID=2885158 RepID=UPI001D07190A|nr:agmatinase [Acidocella sp. KAb 2-4]MCB5945668.1 agmatinase [Acidocella sp. KAb 2-4]